MASVPRIDKSHSSLQRCRHFCNCGYIKTIKHKGCGAQNCQRTPLPLTPKCGREVLALHRNPPKCRFNHCSPGGCFHSMGDLMSVAVGMQTNRLQLAAHLTFLLRDVTHYLSGQSSCAEQLPASCPTKRQRFPAKRSAYLLARSITQPHTM